MTRLACLAVWVLLLTASFARARTTCPPEVLPAARALVEAQCDCAGATHISSYVRCIAHAAHRAAHAGTIPRACQGAIKKCASHSTCGRAGFFACCTTNSSGHTSCAIREGAKSCHKQGSRGAACISPHASCCDACTASGCASPNGAFVDEAR